MTSHAAWSSASTSHTFPACWGSAIIPSCEVSGHLTGTVEDVAWDLDYANHAWQGQIAIDAGDDVHVTWTAYWSGNLHSVEGSVDGEPVHWENDNPDLP